MQGIGRIVLRVLAGAFAAMLALALATYHPLQPHFLSDGNLAAPWSNLCGAFGSYLGGLLDTLFGLGAWLLPLYVGWECWPKPRPLWHRRLAWAALLVSLVVLLGAFGVRGWGGHGGQPVSERRWGGWLGSALWPPLLRLLGPVGLPIVLGVILLFSLLLLAPALTRAAGARLAAWGGSAWPVLNSLPWRGARGMVGMVRRPWLAWTRKDEEPAELDASDARQLTLIAEQQRLMEEQHNALLKAEREAADYRRAHREPPPELGLPVIHSMRLDDLDDEGVVLEGTTDLPALPRDASAVPALVRSGRQQPQKKPLVPERIMHDRYGRTVVQPSLPLTEPTPSRPLPEADPLRGSPLRAEPRTPARGTGASVPSLPESGPADRHELPPRRLFNPPAEHDRIRPEELEPLRDQIQQKLDEFKVKGQVVGLEPGPVVTVFEFQPEAGIPLAKVLGMDEDLALALKAEAIRIDRIPGRNLVGIEVPNPRREIISFREIIDSPAFRDPGSRDGSSLLTLALGKDMGGKPVVSDLARMPHLLIGGSTGSGKSVGVNAMICSVLVRALPEEVKLILVDPKMVELGIYEGIPHLWAPVVTDMKEAGRVLKWVVAQMEDRYRRLALLSVRNLEQFNAKVREQGGRIGLAERTPNPRWPDRPVELEPLPYVVVVIDELADLMMVARGEVEDSIARISQKARAVGIHLILATQRPSVDIVTGVIKANLPSRLSYRVRTKIDSRTILDQGGGELLLGAGDALYLAPGSARPRRIHAPFLTEEETLRLVHWLKERGEPAYNQALISALETEEEAGAEDGAGGDGAASDDIYDRATAVVRRERKASTSLLQRKLNIGYGRAARIIDRMEEEGIIGPDRGAGKPREVLVGEE